MKKLSKKKRERAVKEGVRLRKKSYIKLSNSVTICDDKNWEAINSWFDNWKGNGLNFNIDRKKHITLYLPEKMNFSNEYDSTVLHINAIRKLSKHGRLSYKSYKLKFVNFDNLKKISTSAALVLTAELSKWDDAIRKRLQPVIDNWDKKILRQFIDLGFFELFQNKPLECYESNNHSSTNLQLVKYIKGRCGDSNKTRILKQGIIDIVGDNISKWTFLHSGLTEAITNVSHHAYPVKFGFSDNDKNWYLTGSFNDSTKELKIVFYDQGIGIPKSLPASDVWEKVLKFLSIIPIAERKKDEVLLKAAVSLDRTSTEQNDRGKGLQDLLEFIRQRKDGYLSILSLKGLYKFSMNNGAEKIKSEHFEHSIYGTLIIWSVTL